VGGVHERPCQVARGSLGVSTLLEILELRHPTGPANEAEVVSTLLEILAIAVPTALPLVLP